MLYQLSYSRKWMTKVRGFFGLSRGGQPDPNFFLKKIQAKKKSTVWWTFEREKRLELSTLTLARLCSTN
jgi:hypothetical protein